MLMNRLVDLLAPMNGPMSYIVVFFFLLACGFGLPIPEDITLFAAGVLAYYGEANVFWMIGVTFLGVMLGDIAVFFLGVKVGRNITRRKFFARIITPQRLDEVAVKFRKHGNKILFFGRFMPGIRASIFFSAGTLHVPFRIFLFYDGLAALISVPTIVYLAYFLGDQVEHLMKLTRDVKYLIVFGVVCTLLVILVRWLWTRHRASRLPSA